MDKEPLFIAPTAEPEGKGRKKILAKKYRAVEDHLLRFRFDPMVDDEKEVESVPCPFTREPVILKKVSNGFWMGVGPFYTTRLFDYKRELIWHLAQRPWFVPEFEPRPEVKIKDRLPPYREAMGPEGDKAEKDAQVQATVDEMVERSAKRLGLKK